eukprot:SAG31_NODE_2294_length_5991_cov_2.589613_7_plen_65_part_00
MRKLVRLLLTSTTNRIRIQHTLVAWLQTKARATHANDGAICIFLGRCDLAVVEERRAIVAHLIF